MLILDPKSLPLNQNVLIEASAGTGKTYTITTLYLRALLGLIDGCKQLSPKSIEQILVVTFTDAATQEIRDRVRNKLVATQACLISLAIEGEDTKGDINTLDIIEEFSQGYLALNPDADIQQAYLTAYHQLQDAITLIDEASIFTIHGFCHRCLNQFAFETQSSFEQRFEMDNKPTLQQALFDFWRQQVSELMACEFEWFQRYWRSPSVLYQNIKQVLGKPVQLKPECSQDEYSSLLAKYQRLIATLKSEWIKHDFASVLRNSKLNKRKKVYSRIPLLDAFIRSEQCLVEFGKGESWQLWTTSALADASNYNKNAEVINHSITSVIDQLADVEQELTQGRLQSYWLNTAKSYIEQRCYQLKQELQVINPDDLLTDLLKAINSPQGEVLLEAIRVKYPLAFIDEFQDTDPIQYQIFSAIYANQQQSAKTTTANMVLIGDPKQAIYKFRGADIYTYITAKTQLTQDQHFTLATNWRSHPGLISGVNLMFKQSEQGFLHKDIPFIQVGAGKDEQDNLMIEQQKAKNISFNVLLPQQSDQDKVKAGFSSSDAEIYLAKWCANDIYQLLLGAKNNRTHIQTTNSQPVQAADISILVRNRHQARLIKNALAELGVSSVYLSRDNIFQTELGLDLWRLMQAINTPNNELTIRSACTGLYFNYSHGELLELQGAADKWQQHLIVFHQAHELWLQGKIGLAVETIVHFSQSYRTWYQAEDIDHQRMITDHRHLLELLQQQAVKTSGVEKLLTWFQQQLVPDDMLETSEEKQIRLESDNNLVQITTLHASKGLEYPIVYLPFICEAKPEKSAIFTSQQDQQLTYRVDNRELELQIAEQERLAEDIRLLYVAMTRPIYRLVLGVFNLVDRSEKSMLPQSAFGQLLMPESCVINSDSVTEQCQALVNLLPSVFELHTKSEHIVNDEFNETKQQLDSLLEQQDIRLHFSPFTGEIDHSWKIISYSSLVAGQTHSSKSDIDEDELSVEITLQNRAADEIHVSESTQVLPLVSAQFDSHFDFPKGANAGSCLHWMLENLDFTQAVARQEDVVIEGLAKFSIDPRWLSATLEWMQQVLDSNIRPNTSDVRLNQVTEQNKLVEMEFYFNFKQLDKTVLGNALSMMGLNELYINQLLFVSNTSESISGVLKGFIDLTANLAGKYYVIDYKSNHLGDQYQDYNKAHLSEVMSDHNYYLQALIYILALHRYLKIRLVDYDYNQHIGGALYLFLRGMVGQQQIEERKETSGIFELNVDLHIVEYLDHAITQAERIATKNKTQNNRGNSGNSVNNQQLGFGFD